MIQEISKTKQLLLDISIPSATKTYKPISHRKLIDLTLESIDSQGFNLLSEKYEIAKYGLQATGRYTLNYGNNEMKIMIAWQNSYDKSLSLKYAMGAQIMICKNGMVTGDMGSFKNKHVGKIQTLTPSVIKNIISESADVFYNIEKDSLRMKEIEMTKKASAELLGRMFIQDEIITSTQLNIIKREIENPSFSYGDRGNLWELYNHTTLSLKDAHPANWMKQHINLHNFVTEEFL